MRAISRRATVLDVETVQTFGTSLRSSDARGEWAKMAEVSSSATSRIQSHLQEQLPLASLVVGYLKDLRTTFGLGVHEKRDLEDPVGLWKPVVGSGRRHSARRLFRPKPISICFHWMARGESVPTQVSSFDPVGMCNAAMNTMLRSTIILAMFCVGTSTAAGDVSAKKALATVRAAPGYAASVEAAARDSDAWTINPCLDAKAKLGDPTVVDAPQHDANGSITTGRWLEHVAMDGCETERQLNVAVEAKAAGLTFRPTLPGSTRAPLPLQDALEKKVFSAAGVEPGGCRPYVLGADYDRRSKPVEDDNDDEPVAAGWRERWIVAQCGMRAAVRVEFPTDPTYGELAVQLVKRYAP